MKTINFASEADASDIFSSGNIREIVNTFSYSCEKMCMHKLCTSEKKLRKLNDSIHFRALYDIIFESYVSVYFC